MTEFLVGSLLGLLIAVLAMSRADDPKIAELEHEVARFRAGLGYVMRASREQSLRRFAAHLLDPDGDEAGA